MRIAIISDIHGNSLALEAVLNDLARHGGADHIIVSGDLFVYGPAPYQVLRTLQRLPNIHFLLGNTDRYLLAASYPSGSGDAGWQSALLLSFRWAVAQLGDEGMQFLAGLPGSQVIQAGGRRLLAVHGSPRSDEEGLTSETSDDELRAMRISPETAIVVGGHTHIPVRRDFGGVQVVNAGSVGFPFDGDPRACYAFIPYLMDGDGHAAQVELRRVAYDVEEAARQLTIAGHPAADIGAYNLRTARSMGNKLIYTPEMRAHAQPERLGWEGVTCYGQTSYQHSAG